MINKGYEQKLNIKYSEIDHNSSLKPFALLNFLQDIASDNAEVAGFGYSNIHPRNLAWFLLKYHMEFSEYPTGTHDIILKTETRGYNRLFAHRDFEFWQRDKNIGRITSIWAIIDTKNHTMLKPETVFCGNQSMVPFERRDDDLDFVKIKTPDKFDNENEFTVRYNDLDVNGHANNGNYIVWAFEPLSFDFKTNHRIKTLDIVYKKEAMFGEKVIVNLVYINELTTVHVLKNLQDEELCIIQCEWV